MQNLRDLFHVMRKPPHLIVECVRHGKELCIFFHVMCNPPWDVVEYACTCIMASWAQSDNVDITRLDWWSPHWWLGKIGCFPLMDVMHWRNDWGSLNLLLRFMIGDRRNSSYGEVVQQSILHFTEIRSMHWIRNFGGCPPLHQKILEQQIGWTMSI